MTNHPSFQPSLRRNEVKLLRARLQDMQPAEDEEREYKAGYNDAKAEAVELLSFMWKAAVIANYAAQKDMADHLEALQENGPLGGSNHAD